MTEQGRQIAVVRDYDGLHAALRARAAELQVSRETIDSVSGLQSGYAGKLLAPVPIKGVGRLSLGPLLGALGLMLIVSEDAVALARVQSRLVRSPKSKTMLSQKQDAKPLSMEVIVKVKMAFFRDLGRRGGLGRLALPAAERMLIAQTAARARWAKR